MLDTWGLNTLSQLNSTSTAIREVKAQTHFRCNLAGFSKRLYQILIQAPTSRANLLRLQDIE